MPQEQQLRDGVPTHGPATGPSLISTTSAPATVPAPAPTDDVSCTSTSDQTATLEQIDNWARTIYNYHRMHQPLPTFSPPLPSPPSPSLEDGEEPTRLIFTLCSLDLRVAHYASHLFLTTFLPSSSSTSTTSTSTSAEPRKRAYKYLLFSGHSGLLTRSLTGHPSEDNKKFQSEASLFASIALSLGVPPSSILVEEKSTNTGENVRFTYSLLQEKGIKVDEILLVQKPYMERRTWATFGAQWPFDLSEEVRYSVTSPPLDWREYPDEESGNGRELVMNIMVGDLVRLKEYADRGWQVRMEVPEEVWEAGRRLVEDGGFGGHLPQRFRL
ncbi:DUF218 domain-containing protein [Sordaria brevicollis]|uniref:DUF218 domain-containing protein n=1 Tax=Sordaria brevicollis TaxID=83679 RepID=A0AAE0PED4_SORBR|nr:DUF218 domain-containing protein [Sordaria brevicollis]